MNRSLSTLFRICMILSLLCLNSFISLNGVTSVSAASANQPINHPCGSPQRSTSLEAGPIPPKVLPAGTRSEDADWPIERQETFTQKDASGKDATTTVTIRRNPHPTPPKSDESAMLSVVTADCNYDSTKSMSLTTRSADGGLSQTLKNFYYRYTYTDGNQTWWSYYTYKTQVYYTRTNSSYTLGQNTTTWNFEGADCYGDFQLYSDIGGMVPTWNGNSTPIYYWTFMDQWPTLSPGTTMNLITNASTVAKRSGVTIAPLITEIRYPRTGF